MTNMIKAKIKELQNKAAEISEHFENQSSVYVRSGQDIFEANRENHDDAFLASRVANEYCKAYYDHGWTTAGDKVRYVGEEKNGGRWVDIR